MQQQQHQSNTLLPVWKSKLHGAFVLNHRVVLHAIGQRLLDGASIPRRLTEPGRPVIAEK